MSNKVTIQDITYAIYDDCGALVLRCWKVSDSCVDASLSDTTLLKIQKGQLVLSHVHEDKLFGFIVNQETGKLAFERKGIPYSELESLIGVEPTEKLSAALGGLTVSIPKKKSDNE